jgi:pyruvate ferredoxin oxidoreductase alpha subunit
MNTGYQLSYSTPLGARSATSHIGTAENGKSFMQKDNPQIFSASGTKYVATVSESEPVDFIKKASKAQYYAQNKGTAYIKALSACPLNWNDNPKTERRVIAKAVDCCYHPLYEVENGITKINYNPELKNNKIPVYEWLKMMGRTKHLINEKYSDIVKALQDEIDFRWNRLKEKDSNPLL